MCRSLSLIGAGIDGVVNAEGQQPAPGAHLGRMKGRREAAMSPEGQQAPEHEQRRLGGGEPGDLIGELYRAPPHRAGRDVEADGLKTIRDEQVLGATRVGKEGRQRPDRVQVETIGCRTAGPGANRQHARVGVRPPDRPRMGGRFSRILECVKSPEHGVALS